MKKILIPFLLLTLAVSCHMELPPAPIASFRASEERCQAPCTITFISDSKNADSFEWDFDDDSPTTSGEQVTHRFETGRTYYIKLLAKSGEAGSAGFTKIVTIDEIPESKPVARFTYEPASNITVGTKVTFLNRSDNSVRYQWDFDDEERATEANPNTSTDDRPVHIFTVAGNYTVQLRAFNSKNIPDDTISVITVKNKEVTADFEIIGDKCTAPCEVSFTNKSENATGFKWSFSNGNSSTLENPGKVNFATAGTYTVTLTAEGEGGPKTVTQTITILAGDFTAIAITSTDNGWGNDIVTDADGNIYVCGLVTGDADFGNDIKLKSLYGKADFFVAKYSKSGQCLWAKVAGSSEPDEAKKIALDNRGNVYVAGEVGSSIEGSFAPTVEYYGMKDGFVAKFSAEDGGTRWFRALGGSGDDNVSGLAYSPVNDRVYIAGRVTGSNVNFNGSIYHANEEDAFLVFVDPSSGDIRQPTLVGGVGQQYVNDLTIDREGNAYIAGYFTETLNLPPSHGVPNLTASGGKDAFFAKWELNSGKWVWANPIWSAADETAEEVLVDNAHNVYVTGTHNKDNLSPLGVGAPGNANVFLGKWRADGEVALWGRNGLSNDGVDFAGGMALTSSDNILVCGTYSGSGQFPYYKGPFITSAGYFDVFVSEVSSNGDHVNIKSGGGAGSDHGKAICVSADGHVYSIGAFFGTSDFNGTKLTSVSNNYLNIFIAKWQ